MSKTKLIFTKKAKEDLEEIKQYHSPNGKQRKAILNKFEDLKQQP
jgi:plasmid stabilization system protein ParE